MAARTNFATTATATGSWGTLPVYEATTTFSGDKTPSKQITTTRVSGGAATTETVYYVRSTVLGGKTIEELNASGGWTSSPIYVNGMLVADYKPKLSSSYPDIMLWRHMDPVTGNSAWSGRVGETGGFSQIDPLGNDVTYPPDPLTYEDPHYLDPNVETFWPMEMEWGPSQDFLDAMADYESRINANHDRDQAEYFWSHGRRDLAIDIISQNPNVGIDYRLSGFGLIEPRNGSIFGGQAAGFLTGLDQAIQAGLLVDANVSSRERERASKAPICPPSIDSILDKSAFDADSQGFLDNLISYSMANTNNATRPIKPSRYVEQGGWILMNPEGTKFHYQVKPTEEHDGALRVYLSNREAKRFVGGFLKKGWKIVADFHTHASIGDSVDQGDRNRAVEYQNPGFIIDFNGKTFAYGPKKGFRGTGVPKGCE